MSALNLPIDARTLGYLLLTAFFVGGAITPAAGMGAVGADTGVRANTASAQTSAQTQVDVGVGQQLSTVLFASSEEVQTAFENSAFEAELESEDESERAAAVADRARELREDARSIRADYEEARSAYESGEITSSEYARRLATLHSRAANLLESVATLNERAESVSALELRAEGVDPAELEATVDDVDSVTGVGPAALLLRFTGQSRGEVELESAEGLSIEVRGEDGERSREIERPRDDDDSITVNMSDALATAKATLSDQDGTWVLQRSRVHADSGYYEFEFRLSTGADLDGEAEVRVDGSTGTVFRLEEEIEAPEADDDDDDRSEGDGDRDEDEDDELAIVVVDGVAEPGATVTLEVTSDGEPVTGATVVVNDHEIGTTDANGTVVVQLPDGDAEIEVRSDDAEGELEFEFEDDHDDVFSRLQSSASLEDGTVTVDVTFDGQGVANARIFANGEAVATTDKNGSASFEVDTTAETLELKIVKGEFEAELTYRIDDGALELVESVHEGDDRDEDDERDREDDDHDEDADDHDEDADDHEDDEADDREGDDRTGAEVDGSLEITVVGGTVAAGEDVMIEVRNGGSSVEGATVRLDSEFVGTTDSDGQLTLHLPVDEDDATIEAESGDADGRIELELVAAATTG